MNEKETAAVGLFETELWERVYRRNDEDFVFADLTALYVEIMSEFARIDKDKWAVIYDYSKLLEQELRLYSGADAYIAGKEAKDKPEKDALFGYLRKVADENGALRLDSHIQAAFDEIIGLLGDKSGLITDFTETYRRVHGAVKDNIIEFIRMGQAYGAEVA